MHREICETHVERCVRHTVVYGCIALLDIQIERYVRHM